MPHQQRPGPAADGSKLGRLAPSAVRDAPPESFPDNAVRDSAGRHRKDRACLPARIHPLRQAAWADAHLVIAASPMKAPAMFVVVLRAGA